MKKIAEHGKASFRRDPEFVLKTKIKNVKITEQQQLTTAKHFQRSFADAFGKLTRCLFPFFFQLRTEKSLPLKNKSVEITGTMISAIIVNLSRRRKTLYNS